MQSFLWRLHIFYAEHKRATLPWRRTRHTYRVLLSEVMLQQTQVSRVLVKYQEFLQMFPTAKAVADAPLRDVLTAWQGLGYNRRAKFLHEAARMLVNANASELSDADFLQSLPGVGQSTAGAVLAFTKNKPTVFVETNIRAVILHEFFKKSEEKISDKQITVALKKLLDTTTLSPRDFYYALYDYGTHLKASLGKEKKDLHGKSKHYAKQSRFEGSRRQLRAFILKTFLELNDIRKLFGIVKKKIPVSLKKYSDDDITDVIAELKSEGFFK